MSTLPKLRDIDEELLNILTVDLDELTDEQKAAFQSYMDELLKQKADKIDAIVRYIRVDLDGEIEALGKEIDRLRRRKKSVENRGAWLKSLVVNSLQNFGQVKMKGDTYTVRLSESTSVEMLPDWEKLLPEHLTMKKFSVDPNKNAIKELLKQGETVPGAYLKTSVNLRTS